MLAARTWLLLGVHGWPQCKLRRLGVWCTRDHTSRHGSRHVGHLIPRILHPLTQLLGELLLDRVNVKIMMQYVSDVNNLILMMNLLKDSSRSIQFEAFHVFKVRTGWCLLSTWCVTGPIV